MSRDGEPDKIYIDRRTYKDCLEHLYGKSQEDNKKCKNHVIPVKNTRKHFFKPKKQEIDAAIFGLKINAKSGINYSILKTGE